MARVLRDNDGAFTSAFDGALKQQRVRNRRKTTSSIKSLSPWERRGEGKGKAEVVFRRFLNILKTAVRAPNMNAYALRFVQSIKLECLDHFMISGLTHMDHLCREYLVHFHTERPHQGLDNELPVRGPKRKRGKIEEPESLPNLSEIRCRTRLGGLLKHYERRAV